MCRQPRQNSEYTHVEREKWSYAPFKKRRNAGDKESSKTKRDCNVTAVGCQIVTPPGARESPNVVRGSHPNHLSLTTEGKPCCAGAQRADVKRSSLAEEELGEYPEYDVVQRETGDLAVLSMYSNVSYSEAELVADIQAAWKTLKRNPLDTTAEATIESRNRMLAVLRKSEEGCTGSVTFGERLERAIAEQAQPTSVQAESGSPVEPRVDALASPPNHVEAPLVPEQATNVTPLATPPPGPMPRAKSLPRGPKISLEELQRESRRERYAVSVNP